MGIVRASHDSCNNVAWRWWGGHLVAWERVVSFAVAAAAILLWTVFGMTTLTGGGTAIIAPLAVLRGADVPVDALSIAARVRSDLAFPIAVILLWPETRRWPVLVLAWAAYGIGLGQGLLLAESGDRMSAGDFMWS